MDKETKRLILGIVIGIILAIIINVIFSQILPDSSSKYEIQYYEDGKLISSNLPSICSDAGSCILFDADQYNLKVEPDSLTQINYRVNYNDCKDEFEKRIGKELKGFCELRDVLASDKGITSYYCNCWSN